MKRYEYKAGTSSKFWQYEDLGNGMAEVSWGRIGSVGRSQEISLAEAEKRESEKIAKGYISYFKQMPIDSSKRTVERRIPTDYDEMWNEFSKKIEGE